jgi:hypothetical protein
MGLRGGAGKRPRGNDGSKIDKAQRISDAKDEYQNLIVLTDPLVQNNAPLQNIVKNASTLLASVLGDPIEGLNKILRALTVTDLQTISEGLAGTNGDIKVDHIARVLFAQDLTLISNQEKACKNLRLIINQSNKIAVLSGFANDAGIIDFKYFSKALMDIIIEKSRSNGTDDMHT